MQGDTLLWLRRALEPRRNYWMIPAGFLESGETTTQAAVREVLEETNVALDESSLHLHGVGSVAHMDEVYVVYRARVDQVTPAPGVEALEARFFSEHEMPWSEMAFPEVSYLARLTYQDMRRGRHGVYLTQHELSQFIDQL
jgi:ADP-ribose pyrophosphatase YjhB (NUDIX family)